MFIKSVSLCLILFWRQATAQHGFSLKILHKQASLLCNITGLDTVSCKDKFYDLGQTGVLQQESEFAREAASICLEKSKPKGFEVLAKTWKNDKSSLVADSGSFVPNEWSDKARNEAGLKAHGAMFDKWSIPIEADEEPFVKALHATFGGRGERSFVNSQKLAREFLATDAMIDAIYDPASVGVAMDLQCSQVSCRDASGKEVEPPRIRTAASEDPELEDDGNSGSNGGSGSTEHSEGSSPSAHRGNSNEEDNTPEEKPQAASESEPEPEIEEQFEPTSEDDFDAIVDSEDVEGDLDSSPMLREPGFLSTMERCQIEEEGKLRDRAARTRTAEQPDQVREADENLKKGFMCDKKIYGNKFCLKWKNKLTEDQLSPEMVPENQGLNEDLQSVKELCHEPANLKRCTHIVKVFIRDYELSPGLEQTVLDITQQ